MTHATDIANYLKHLHTDRAIGEAFMALVRMARSGDKEAHAEVAKTVEWLLREWKL